MSNYVYPLEDKIGFVSLMRSLGDDSSIVNAARVSLGKQSDALRLDRAGAMFSDDELIELNKIHPQTCYAKELEERNKDRKLIRYLLEHDHGTPFEHNCLTFHVKAPLFIARQWMRHRISSFNEISARYTEVNEEFYVPKNFRKQSDSNRQASTDQSPEESEKIKLKYETLIDQAFYTYKILLEDGLCREQARAVLPLATYTEFYWTINLRSFLHFIKLRSHSGAQWEIVQYALSMLDLVEPQFPETIKIWKELNSI